MRQVYKEPQFKCEVLWASKGGEIKFSSGEPDGLVSGPSKIMGSGWLGKKDIQGEECRLLLNTI